MLAQEHSQPQLIVLHLMGSHPQACDRTQGKYENLCAVERNVVLSLYHDANGRFTAQAVRSVTNSGSSFSLVYFSDHGLAFKERGKDVQYLAHDDKYQQNFQVPFMVISSDDKAHRVIKARRSANDFLGFFSQWTGIKAKEINIKYPLYLRRKPGRYTSPTSSYRRWITTISEPIFSTRSLKNKKSAPRGGFLYHQSD
ncbi:membrane protein YbiP [Escherichia coli]|uniref:Membrane protein YbiP n=1 Tax=Escherichia coli TaxID=562 RepID=A0A376UF35_ECOLX|nr:membrane protein YbiP [Escherichia coli]